MGHCVYLSRRNLLTLLNKLDRVAAGGTSFRTIVKYDNVHPVYPQSMDICSVTAVEDAEYYRERPAGRMLAKDEPK